MPGAADQAGEEGGGGGNQLRGRHGQPQAGDTGTVFSMLAPYSVYAKISIFLRFHNKASSFTISAGYVTPASQSPRGIIPRRVNVHS